MMRKLLVIIVLTFNPVAAIPLEVITNPYQDINYYNSNCSCQESDDEYEEITFELEVYEYF